MNIIVKLKSKVAVILTVILFTTLQSYATIVDIVKDGLMYSIDTELKEGSCKGPIKGTDCSIDNPTISEYVTYKGETFNITRIEDLSFNGCSGITGSLTIPATVTYIGGQAFKDCSGLTGTLIIPNSVKIISYSAFSGCINLKALIVEDGSEPLSFYEYSAYDVFNSCPFESIHLGRNLIGDWNDGQPFHQMENLTSVSFGEGATTLNNVNMLFYGCPKLRSVRIPNTVTSISAFGNCLNLNELIIEDGSNPLSLNGFSNCPLETIYIGRNMAARFIPNANYSNLSSITISNSVSLIGDCAFENCTWLSSLTIPSSVIAIGNNAFKGCSALKELIFEDSTEPFSTGGSSIGECAFEDCTELSSLTIPNTVTSIGNNAFKGCTALKELILEGSAEPLSMGESSIGECAFEDCTGLSSLSIPNTVTSIGNNAFKGCTALKELIFEDGTELLSLGNGNENNSGNICGLFFDIQLEKFYLGRNISFSTRPFKLNNETLIDVTISNSVTTIPDYIFYGCRGLTSVSIGESVESIGSNAFAFCTNLTSVTLPNSLTSIGNEAFLSNRSFREIVIPDSVVSIGSEAFGECGSLDLISIGKSLTAISKDAFLNSYPDYVKTYTYHIDGIELSGLGPNAKVIIIMTDTDFSGIGTTNLTYFNELVLNNGNTEYGLVISPQNLDFANCIFAAGDKYVVPLTGSDVRISTDSQRIVFRGEDISEQAATEDGFSFSPSAFHKENVFNVYGNAENPSLTQTIYLDEAGTLFSKLDLNNIEKIEVLTLSGDINGTDVMTINRMSSLKYLDITNANIVEGGLTYRDNFKTVNDVIGERFFCYVNLEVIYLPASIIKIDNEALADMPLRVVKIPSSTSYIGNSAFMNCPNIIHLTIPNSVQYIGDKAFYYCMGIKYLTIEDSRSELSLGASPFTSCKLESLYLGRNLSYRESPFSSINSLATVTISDSVTLVGKHTFEYTGLKSVIIPGTVTAIGERAFACCWEMETIEMSDSLKSIGKQAFYNNLRLKSISLPTGIEMIEDETFAECHLLESVSMEEGVTSIGVSAFKNCADLSSITIPHSVESIGEYAFYNTALKEVLLPAAVKKIGDYAFAQNTGITKVISLNTTPPEIFTNTFDSEVETSIPLHVQNGSLMYYWLDPVWKEFKNISDDAFCLQAIPDAKYGDGETDLAQYAPEGAEFIYKSSNEDVVKINGSVIQIVGAGTATVEAYPNQKEPHMELVGQMRQIFVDKADLTITVDEIVIEQGESVPDFKYLAEGLQYDDTLDDIDILPQPIHNVNENSPIGEYAVSFTDGSDRNYRIATKPSKITVSIKTGVKDNMSDAAGQDIEVYDLEGLLIYRGPRRDAVLQKGIYIVRQGAETRKVTVR